MDRFNDLEPGRMARGCAVAPSTTEEEEVKPRKPIRHTSTARAKQLREYRKVKYAFLCEHTRCEVCKRPLIFAERELHHAYGRNGRLLCWVPGFRCLCHRCHSAVHLLPTLAIERGYMGPMGTFNDYSRAVAHYEANK